MFKEIDNFHIKIPEDYLKFVNELYDKNIETYFVGGCVRDALLGFEYYDFDIFCLSTKDIFKERVNDVKILTDFDNVLIVEDDDYNVFTISFNESFDDDFNKRDLTINSIYYNSMTKTVFGFPISFEDIRDEMLRPCDYNIFSTDTLKLLRAIRLEGKLNFFLWSGHYKIFFMDLKDIDTKFKAFRLRNELLKHDIKHLNKYFLLGKIIDKLREFQVII